MTNFEKIKSMGIEELCEFLFDEIFDDCSDFTIAYFGSRTCLGVDEIKKWLESEAE